MINKIGKSVYLRYGMLFILTFLPLLFVSSLIFLKENKLSQIKKKIDQLSLYATKTKKSRDSQKEYFEKIKMGSPEFIKKNIESFIFLKGEIAELDNYLKYDFFKSNLELQKRYQFLTDESNKLTFKRENFKIVNTLRESEEKQKHPIEATFEDLLSLLSLIEDKQINDLSPPILSPMMIIKKIEIKKILNNNLSINNLCIIKRDFIDP
jgi:hypothetical protein